MEELGSNGASRGARIATSTQNRTRIVPIIPTQLSRKSPKDFRARLIAAPYPAVGIRVVAVGVFIVYFLI
jgi:hypothetical protein